jgi:Holliday junction resolvase RusA-like endonuclease
MRYLKTYEIPIAAAPAARPRVARAGWSYYPAKYAKFKKELHAALKQAAEDTKPLAFTFWLNLLITLKKPKTSKLDYPKPDVDNYAKAVMDAGNGVLWEDDWFCESLSVKKQWGTEDKITLEILSNK